MARRTTRAGALLFGSAVAVLIVFADAAAALVRATKVVTYRGYTLAVPRSWPVYDLAAHPSTCVRFDRHAVYLGAPSADQRCPAHAVGRTEALLLQPLARRFTFPRAQPSARSPLSIASLSGSSASELVVRDHGLLVTAAWGHHPALVTRALGVHALRSVPAAAAPSTAVAPGARAALAPATRAALTAEARPAAAASGAGIYTGLGFDTCAAPSRRALAAWSRSSYRAVGIYIGGANMACAQPNLTAAWVGAESAAGWHLIPTYVGLQAPGNSCGCAAITPSRAAAQGTAAAVDAVARASAIGIGAGNPIYYDMEAYSRTASNSSSVLRFLAAWTSELHAQGYVSGAYGSGGSGIRDMAAAFGTGYTEPDDIWIGDWNSLETIDDPYVPAGDWTPHRRVHQYRGAHAERHGAVTLSIDGDYVDGATASASGVMNDRVLRPTLSVTSLADGTMRLHLSWPGVTGITRWRVLGGSSTSSLIPIGRSRRGGSRAAITSHSAYPYFEAQAIGPSGAVLASTPVAATPPHVAIYGRTIFIPGGGLGAVPVGCFTVSACELSTTILAGRTRLARTRPEQIPAGGAALVRFRLSALGRSALARAANRRLPVSVTVRDVSGRSATRRLIMIPVVLNGPGPARAVENSPTLRLLTLTDFVSSRGVGGILAGCFDTAPCRVTTAITSGRTRLARTGPEVLGVNEVGYLTFRLTPQALARLAHALGHQLRARVTLSDRGAVATATVALAAFR